MMTEQDRELSRAWGKETRAGREVRSRADFPCRAAACQAEGQQRAVANQFLIENEPSNDAWAQLPAWGCWSRLHQQLRSPNLFFFPHVQGITAPPASLPREGSRDRSILLSCCLPARAGGGGAGLCLETHGETTISSKLRICWSSGAALTGRAGALLDPYVILCSQSQDPTVEFVRPRQERAAEPKRFPGCCKQGCILLPAPGVPPSRDVPFIPTSLRGQVAVVVFPEVHGFKPCIPTHPASSKSSPVSGEKPPQTCPQPPQLSLTPHFHVSSSHLSLTGPSSLLSLVPQLIRVNGCDPTWLRSTRTAWKCFGLGRGMGSRSSLE